MRTASNSNPNKTFPNLLIVEDEPQIREILSELLATDFRVRVASNGEEAIEAIELELPDIVLMDIIMPKLDGIAVCRRLRENPRTQSIPILMLTAANSKEQRINAYEFGADDFIAKPFDIPEVITRLKNKYQRSQVMSPKSTHDTRTVANLTLDISTRTATVGSRKVRLTPVEFGILTLLITNFGKMVDRKTILDSVWKNATQKGRLLDAHVTSLRKKLNGFTGEISTVYGAGYILMDHKETEGEKAHSA